MTKAALQDWLERLEKLHPEEIDLGLERIRRVAEAMDLLPLPQPVVTVAGTNGKGSTVAVLEALLRQQGKRVGTFTSPHLLRFNERIRVDGREADDARIVEAFEAIESARGETTLTYFEFAALAALVVFRAAAPDVVVLEVGLGGRLDAVNIVDPTVAVITSIALDHQGWLGDTRDAIAVEKAGILRNGAAAVIADADPPESLVKAVADRGASPAVFLGRDFSAVTTPGGTGEITLWRDGQAPQALAPVALGGLLPENIAAALQAALLLGCTFDDADVQAALAKVVLSGRRQRVERDGVVYLLDVAHNPAAVERLLAYLGENAGTGRTLAVFSVMRDKDYAAIIRAAADTFDAWLIADQPRNARAATAVELGDVLAQLGVERVSYNDNVRQALARARQLARPGDTIVVFGSFTTVGIALEKLSVNDALREAG
jgi:dihydrofolate synthase/folylpolyglutamate synthase